MIRIKVISVRQAFNSIMSSMVVATIIVFVAFIFFSSFYILKEALKNNVLFENEFAIETLSRSKMIKEIYLDEFPNATFKEEASFPIEVKRDENQSSTNNVDINVVKNESNLDVEITEKRKYELPSKYDVELYDSGKVRVGNMVITNYTKRQLDLAELSKPSDIMITKNSNFLLFHTHTSESYTFSDNTSVTNYRTIDSRYNMISVGKILYDKLKAKGYNCVHDEELHDYPSYNGAYRSSLATVEKYLSNQKFDFVIDIHRDALSSNLGFRPTVNIDGNTAAKLMFVVGTNASGLSHDEWMKNLKLAIMIQNRANEMYPGLFRDLNLSKSRYNQHVSNGAFIIEVGATGNTLEEAQNSMKCLANVIDSFVQ